MKTLNKRSLTATILGLTMILCAACGNSQATETATKNDTKNTNVSSGEQKKMKRPDVVGEVKSIIGNSITIALAKMPEKEMTNTTGKSTTTAQDGPPAGGPPMDGGGPAGGSESGKSSAGGTGKSTTSGSGNNNRSFTLTLTGETKEVMIPVGVEITSGGGKTAKSIDIADIQKGDTIMIYYVEGSQTIERVSIR